MPSKDDTLAPVTIKRSRKRGLSVGPARDDVTTSSSSSVSATLKSIVADVRHEDRLKQAFYYSAANALLIVLGGAGIALWFVFQEFIEPLFWAVLCGALLHPLKTYWVQSTEIWLFKLTKRRIPLVFGIIIFILTIPGMTFRFFTRTTSRTILVVTALVINIGIDFVGWELILASFIGSTRFLLASATLVIDALVYSGDSVRSFTADINLYVVTSNALLYFTVVYCEVKELVNPKYSIWVKWLIWLFMGTIAYPYLVYNWITVFIASGFVLCAFVGFQQIVKSKKRSSTLEQLPSLVVGRNHESISTEVITILFIFCIMYIANIVQVVVFLLGISLFYWIALGIKHTALRIVRYQTLMDHLAPQPFRFFWECFEKGDQIIIQWIRRQLNLIYSVLIILFLVLGAILVLLFFSVQLYEENSKLAEDIWSQRTTLLPVIHEHEYFKRYLNKTAEFDAIYNKTTSLVFAHGEDWVEDKLSDIIGVEVDINDMMVITGEFWEDTSGALSKLQWNVPTSIIMDLIRSGDAASFWTAYGSNVSIVVETIWSQFLINIRLVWWVVLKGWGLFNFMFSLLLFLTSLFYLIASSDSDTYKPMSWVLFFFPEQALREKAGKLINESVSQVFMTAFKLALFHGLWCWCTLHLFGCHLIYLPTLLAALMALLPLLPTYFDCIPGVLELWLVWSRPFSAISLFVLHLAASWWIDPMIYAEIESSHHYITGLSVVGGLYFFGIQGVFIGPMLVCAILVMRKITMVMSGPDSASDTP